jgi:hypothetical protein
MISNGGPNIFTLAFGSGSFSAWGVTRIFFGLLLACNQVLLVLVGRRWPRNKIHRLDLSEEVRTAESILQA